MTSSIRGGVGIFENSNSFTSFFLDRYKLVNCLPDNVDAEQIPKGLKSVAESLLIQAGWDVAHVECYRGVGGHLREATNNNWK